MPVCEVIAFVSQYIKTLEVRNKRQHFRQFVPKSNDINIKGKIAIICINFYYVIACDRMEVLLRKKK